MKKNNSGAALVYVLMALVLVGAVGSLVLNMSGKEKTDSGLRASSEMSRFAATAGLTYAEGWFTNTSTAEHRNRVDNLLSAWHTNRPNVAYPTAPNTPRWITGTTNTDSSYLLKGDMRFRVKIVNIDFSNVRAITEPAPTPANPNRRRLIPGMTPEDSWATIMFESEAIDNSGSRAKNFGFYNIFGFEDGNPPGEINTLHLGNINEINTRLIVNGSTYFQDIRSTTSPSGVINGTGHEFNGRFIRMAPNNQATSFNIGGVTFGGLTYFGVLPAVTIPPTIVPNGGATVFRQGFGSESPITTTSSGVEVRGGDVYLNNNMRVDGSGGTIRFTGTGHTLHGSQVRGDGSSIDYTITNSANPACVPNPANQPIRCLIRSGGNNVTTPALTTTPMNIPVLMGINVNPVVLTINWNLQEFVAAGTHEITQTGITGAQLSGFGAANVFRGWRVVEIKNGARFNGGTFTGNTILIVNTSYAGNGLDDGNSWNFPTSAPGSRLVIISKDGNRIARFRTVANGTVRGLVISENNGRFLAGGNMTFEGAVHLTGNADFRLDGGGTTTITENRPLVNEILRELNGFINSSVAGTPAGAALRRISEEFNPEGITTTMLGRGY